MDRIIIEYQSPDSRQLSRLVMAAVLGVLKKKQCKQGIHITGWNGGRQQEPVRLCGRWQ